MPIDVDGSDRRAGTIDDRHATPAHRKIDGPADRNSSADASFDAGRCGAERRPRCGQAVKMAHDHRGTGCWPGGFEVGSAVSGQEHRREMSAAEIDTYLGRLDEPKRSTLTHLRDVLCQLLPDAEETMSYGMPTFKVQGKTVAGFAAFKNHLSYLPHSGSVFPELADHLAGYRYSSGALQFPIDEALPDELVERLVAVRLRQAGLTSGA